MVNAMPCSSRIWTKI